jgi:hypothetical protein
MGRGSRVDEPMVYARQVTLIETRLTKRGAGKTMDDPVRLVMQYWTLDGDLVAEVDAYATPKSGADS